jgi:hypothetical protein
MVPIAALVVALVAPAAAGAVGPRAASANVRACLERAGASVKVDRDGGGGKATFPGLRKWKLGPSISVDTYRFVWWGWMTVNGRVAGAITQSTLDGRQKQQAEACLRPYNHH